MESKEPSITPNMRNILSQASKYIQINTVFLLCNYIVSSYRYVYAQVRLQYSDITRTVTLFRISNDSCDAKE